MHGFVGQVNPRRRVAGYSPGEAEASAEHMAALRRHQAAILPTADALLSAYDALVLAAVERGFDVSALDRVRHPRVQRMHDELDELHRRYP